MMQLLTLAVLLIASSADAGVSYIRWGRKSCPAGNIKLYDGYMAAGKWDWGGSGANYQCMNIKPDFVRGIPGRQGISGMIFGVEIEYVDHFKNKGLIKTENIPDGELDNEDMPCVRCHDPNSSDHYVMPGRQDCGDSGYELQYKGYLVSEWNDGRRRGQYVCLDEAPEGISGGSGNNNDAVVVPVEIGCGSLPCNPYVDGMEATCAVCTY